jgi:aminopeptidase
MAVGGIGPLKKSVKLTVHKGKVEKTECEDKQALKRVQDSLNTDATSSTVGEFAFGINAKARFVEEFLEAEKVLGTVHIAFGDNSDMPGGKNPSRNHMDLLMSKPTVKATNKDGSTFQALTNGAFQKT